ncbi:Hypothetical Protein FCC1311_044782 [Hondaea fermentalgiana]|uniref:Uncharacterized protein n=1 Tax=Hondaea fermentalgiana TaxID=2315210 RepID=A0A2R5GCG9_9STRA|nr:Hypothetical Protein FCC1311_044782 [Hondaea fermentalgiana]|eukprot:GBG28255.1 Hypothetical Protein FCC1311_044782 [Hondaea fermentalgiana]
MAATKEAALEHGPDGSHEEGGDLGDEAFELFTAAQAHEEGGDLDEAFALYERIEALALGQSPAGAGERRDPRWKFAELVASDEPPLHVLAATAANCAGGLFLDEGEYTEARSWFQRSLQWWDAAVMARLNLGNIEREHGNPEVAISLYSKIAEQEQEWASQRNEFTAKSDADAQAAQDSWISNWLEHPLRSCGQQAAYLIALMHHQWGRYDAAVPYLQKYPVKWRIGPAVWKCVGKSSEADPGASLEVDQTCPVRLVKGALNDELLAALQHAFRPSSTFWDGTNYCDGAYFSFWYEIDRKPSNLVEQAIQELLSHLGRDDIVGAEWWVHSRPSGRNLGHQLHFDTEENSLGGENETILHPAVSSVVYLTGAATGAGPTVVFDQRVQDVTPGKRAFVSNPVDGSFLTFPGDRLHGVLPGRPPKPGKRTRQAETKLRDPTSEPHRLTLLVGFWTREVQKIGKRRRLGPCAPFPRASRGVDWPSEIDTIPLSDESKASTSGSSIVPLPVHRVPEGQAWEAVPPGPHPPQYETLPDGLDQHFFVADHAEFRRRLLSTNAGNDEDDDDVDDAEANIDVEEENNDDDASGDGASSAK